MYSEQLLRTVCQVELYELREHTWPVLCTIALYSEQLRVQHARQRTEEFIRASQKEHAHCSYLQSLPGSTSSTPATIRTRSSECGSAQPIKPANMSSSPFLVARFPFPVMRCF